MVYLKNFVLLDDYAEHWICCDKKVTRLDNSVYPLHIFPPKEFQEIEFSPITIVYGGNGSGKSTLLNIISEKLKSRRKSDLDKGLYFDRYVEQCKCEMDYREPLEIKTITSDDVFDYLLDVRAINSGVSRKKALLTQEFLEKKFTVGSDDIFDLEAMKAQRDASCMTQAQYTRARLANKNITEFSNGESALLFWEREIGEQSIYILDEPENSLSAENQLKLKKFIEDSVRFFDCQFIISTHSPFLLALDDAKIYDLDSKPVSIKKWTDLKNVKLYYDFFKEHDKEF